jgi:hypothetical protein
MLVMDVPCQEVIEAIPVRLTENDIPFAWIDETQGLLSVGPLTEETKAINGFSRVRQTYFLTTRCRDIVITEIGLKGVVAGLNGQGTWVEIVEQEVIERYGSDLFRLIRPEP